MIRFPKGSDRVLTLDKTGVMPGVGVMGFGTMKVPKNNKKGYRKLNVIWGIEGNCEHVSVEPVNGGCPTWAEMCFVKDYFWEDEDEVVQIHPKKSEYVNIVENCLHLWRPINGILFPASK